ncbi:UNVERIFIED_CONTAM: protein BASIC PENTACYSTEINE2 [Sesamum angustifolium]|uniref:GAGA-binding transcriptional activator n=1 Tax=Sesamum angustifolium TaxID=2727405 RepID=A0AAW2M5U1_9LAMI
MDITGIPIPVCSCTGTPQQCYRWGCGVGSLLVAPQLYRCIHCHEHKTWGELLRKMSQGAFKKVLEKLAAEGYNFANPIDLRTYWAKHGTNKFVIISYLLGTL